MNFIQLGCSDIGPNGKAYVNDALSSGRLSNGKYTKRFESEFSAHHGCKYGLFVNSGTDALRIALATLKEAHGWKDGDEVICPAVTFVATANIILQNGLHPRFVDVNPHTYNINLTLLPRMINPKTRAIIAVHLFGLPADMGKVWWIAKRHSLKIIEDSCETMFVTTNEKQVGSFGHIACFSTYMAHLITTGVGGLAITNNAKYDKLMRSYANHGRDPQYLGGALGFQEIGNPQIIKNRFKFDRVGYSSRCTEMEAALGCDQLERHAEIVFARICNGDLLKTYLKFAGMEEFLQLPADRPGLGNAYMMFPLVCRSGKRDNLLIHLEKNGIETRPMMPLLTQKIYKESIASYPVANWINKNGFYIACHQKLTDSDLRHIVTMLKSFYS